MHVCPSGRTIGPGPQCCARNAVGASFAVLLADDLTDGEAGVTVDLARICQ